MVLTKMSFFKSIKTSMHGECIRMSSSFSRGYVNLKYSVHTREDFRSAILIVFSWCLNASCTYTKFSGRSRVSEKCTNTKTCGGNSDIKVSAKLDR